MAPPPPPPPPPPPICLPFFGSKKPNRRLSFSSTATPFSAADNEKLVRQGSHRSANSYSTSSSINSMTNPSMSNFTALTFRTDSEKYDDIPTDALDRKGKLIRSNTMTGTPKKEKEKDKGMPTRWGYGFGLGKKKEAEADAAAETNLMRGMSQRTLPVYQATSQPPTRHNSQSTQASRSTQRTQDTQKTGRSHRSQESRSGAMPYRSQGKTGVTGYRASQETLVQSDSMYRRKLDDTGSIREVVPTSQRLEDLRKQMQRERIDIYIIPSEDAHGSEYVAASDQRRRFISGFSGSTGHAIVTDSSAYLVTDSRYWLQAIEQIDENWKLVRAGHPGEPGDWIEFLETICQGKRIGVDGRMLSYDKAMTINNKINHKDSKLVYPVQNLVDLIWKDKPSRSKDPVFTQPREFTGEDAQSKIAKVRAWLKSRPPDRPSYARSEPKPQHYQVGTLITALDHIAYILNLRGSDIPYNPLFHAYLFIGLDSTILFLEGSKVNEEVNTCLNAYGVERRDYNDIWKFLRKREWGGDGKIIIAPESSYTISLVLSNYRTTVLPSYIMNMMAVKNDTEIEGLRRAYLRDGVAFVQFLAWLEDKIKNKGYDITEWEASQRILEFRKKQPNFMGLAYATISATGAHAALPHYVPRKSEAAVINSDTPYLNDSGGQYRDGTCDTTRTVHLGRPTPEQCDAYTRVLQGHIAIDTAVFPDGTSGRQLDVLARNALWREGMNYGHGTGHGFGSFLTVHEGPHGFTSEAPLRAGYVITNEPGYYLDKKWGIRIESALVIRRARTKHDSNGDWLSFERLTCVPIQLRMVNKDLLTSAEKTWLIAHNKECFRKLKPLLYNDKRALDWLKREANRDIGIAAAGPGGLTIEWG